MGHLYPLAPDAERALAGAAHAARTRADAERLASGSTVEKLETAWLTPEPEEADAILARADTVAGEGFVQRYEDEAGNPVLAVTFWRLSADAGAGSTRTPKQDAKAMPPPPAADHTDDLYFRAGRTKKRKARKRHVDPRQLDLFPGPDQQGFEHRDPLNPAIIITDEEGDGTTFGD
ncbi:MAG: hypothetical protein AAFR94_03770 [Pseudomonadota bacterium]